MQAVRKEGPGLRLQCACGKAMAVRPELAGKRVRCPACRGVVEVPATRRRARCPSCGEIADPSHPSCLRCGWNPVRKQRECLLCRGDVAWRVDLARVIGLFVVGVVAGVGLSIWLGVISFPVAAGAFLAAAAFLAARTAGYACRRCAAPVASPVLRPAERERLLKVRRGGFAAAAALGLVALVAAIPWGVGIVGKVRKALPSSSPAAGFADARVRRGTVNVDNWSPEPWTVWIDGKEEGTVPPFGVYEGTVAAGRHELRIVQGAQELDRVEADVPADKVAVINPGGRASYLYMTHTYHSAGMGPPDEPVPVNGQRVVTADCGLTSGAPEVIFVREDQGGPATRTKVFRMLPEEPSPAEAAVILTGSPWLYFGCDDGKERAIQVLLSAGVPPAVRDWLVQKIEAREDVRETFQLAVSLGAELPEDRLTAWLTARCSQHGPTASCPDVGCEGAWALHCLGYLARVGRTGIIADQFPRLPPRTRGWVLEGRPGEWAGPAEPVARLYELASDSQDFRRGVMSFVMAGENPRGPLREDKVPLALRVLRDPDPLIRRDLFFFLCQAAWDRPEVREELRQAVERETDESAAVWMRTVLERAAEQP